MASMDDMFHAQKNLVEAVNGVSNTLMTIEGKIASTELSSPTVIKTSAGWLARVSVLTAGTESGAFYDAVNTGAVANTKLAVIPNAVEVTEIKLPFAKGLTMVPGAGMIVTVSYS